MTFLQPRRDLYARTFGAEGNEEMMIARQTLNGGIHQHFPDNAAQCVLHHEIVTDEISGGLVLGHHAS
jgi:hypothetical protein